MGRLHSKALLWCPVVRRLILALLLVDLLAPCVGVARVESICADPATSVGFSERPKMFMSAETGGQKNSPARSTFRQFDDDTKPKHESKAREIDRAEETEMMGVGVENHRTIELDVKRPADHDYATREARNPTATKLWTISSSTN
ncbi:hypothetical protein THAOC_28628 [Thalassiosira oceanica]|uniref:RxLR effector protein n=1 Tax=Thalassiosira oceanica TaxID=159749 RepID=K0RFX9_THAOC|nr:hypothetical protein THAOC_28628 [Thalassiosira oceanica]|eukprot:EJK52135.1 hypothetical protein THAOC_28628 [Thalassiosira oceanica]